KRRAATENVELPEDVCYYIASKIRTNVRALEGSLVRLLAVTSLQSKEITLELAKTALADLLPSETPLDAKRVLHVVAEDFAVTPALLCGHSRTQSLVLARQVAMYFMRNLLNLSLKEIGRHLGGRDHSTVLHALAKVEHLRSTNTAFANRLSTLQQRITSEQTP
ncbi:MAG: helix-turn-helix domain-containing protein, partial [candidate division WOR-3 bacterium]